MSDRNTAFAVIAVFAIITFAGYLFSQNDVSSHMKQQTTPAVASTLTVSIDNATCQSPNIVLAKITNNTDSPIFYTSFKLNARTKERSSIIYGQSFSTDIIIDPHSIKNICFEYIPSRVLESPPQIRSDLDRMYVTENYDFIKNLVYTTFDTQFRYGQQ